VESGSHLEEYSSHETEIQQSIYVFMNLEIKIYQTSFHCALQNFKIDVDIAIEKPHNHADRIHWVI
jgi:hypothetical protein